MNDRDNAETDAKFDLFPYFHSFISHILSPQLPVLQSPIHVSVIVVGNRCGLNDVR